MLFSIIIPVYNVERYLRACLDSVIAQTFTDWEAVCINDGSTDGSVAILREYTVRDGRIKSISQPNRGLSAARNAGLDAANGSFILFLDSDDWLEPSALEVLSGNLNEDDMICFSGRRFFESEGRIQPSDDFVRQHYSSGMDYYNDNALQHRDFAFVCVVLRLYKRSFLEDNNLRFKEGILHEDDLFTPQVCYFAQGVSVIDECLYNYRVRSNSITTTKSLKRVVDLMSTANELAAFFTSRGGFDKTVAYRSITHHYQVVFSEVAAEEKKKIRKMCDWRLYRIVSCTKFRHIVNYWINKLKLYV